MQVKEKNDSLVETGELKRFIISLDDFLSWLQHISEACSSEDLPQSLSEVESLLDAHFELKVKSFYNFFFTKLIQKYSYYFDIFITIKINTNVY